MGRLELIGTPSDGMPSTSQMRSIIWIRFFPRYFVLYRALRKAKHCDWLGRQSLANQNTVQPKDFRAGYYKTKEVKIVYFEFPYIRPLISPELAFLFMFRYPYYYRFLT